MLGDVVASVPIESYPVSRVQLTLWIVLSFLPLVSTVIHMSDVVIVLRLEKMCVVPLGINVLLRLSVVSVDLPLDLHLRTNVVVSCPVYLLPIRLIGSFVLFECTTATCVTFCLAVVSI